MSKAESTNGVRIAIERWGMKLTLEFLGVKEISDYARKRIEDDLFNVLQEMGCEFDGNGFLTWTPDSKGLLATGEDC